VVGGGRPGRAGGAGAAGAPEVDVALPPPTATRVKTAEFISSAVRPDQCPPATLPEFAVIGRSNVGARARPRPAAGDPLCSPAAATARSVRAGKSSLVNMLTNNKSLAKVSKTPGARPAARPRAPPAAAAPRLTRRRRPAGKTQCINHFLINGAWYLVDLPGYGYAKRSKALRAEWSGFTQQYFLERPTLANVLLLVDASVPVQALDLEVADWLGNAQVPFSLGRPPPSTLTPPCADPSRALTARARPRRCPSRSCSPRPTSARRACRRRRRTSARSRRACSPGNAVGRWRALPRRGTDAGGRGAQERLLQDWAYLPGVVATSTVAGTGRQELLAYIAQLRDLFIRERGRPAR